MAGDLGWDADRVRGEVDRYRAAVEHERAIAGLPETRLEAAAFGA
ncbi:MAG: hypothetical protein U5R31_13810 [Acidimicrobiia bacterium]|nr:hypothetical protein [Acidimicrobiia bacterium]